MRRAIYGFLLRTPLKIASGSATAIGAIGTIWPAWVQSRIGEAMTADQIELISKALLIAGIIYFALLWLLKPGEQPDVSPPQPSNTTHGPHSPNLSGTFTGPVTFNPAPAERQRRKQSVDYGFRGRRSAAEIMLRRMREQEVVCPELPIWQVVEHVSRVIGDTDTGQSYPEARRQIRQAALEGRLELWGRREIPPEHMQSPQQASNVWSPVNADYWHLYELSPQATVERFDDRDHTWLESFKRKIGERYWSLRARKKQVKRIWREPPRPEPTRGGGGRPPP